MPIHGFNDELIDVLATALGRSCYSNPRSNLSMSLSKAANLMEVVANKSDSTVQMIRIELCKAYLHRTLTCNNADSSTYCLANVYLAVLYYETAQYQTAIDHCTLVIRSQDQSQCSSYVVQGEILPQH